MNEETLIKLVKNNTRAMDRVANAVEMLNDQNSLHYRKDDDRDSVLKGLVSSGNATQKVFYITICALIILAGAEKLFQFIKI